VIIYLDLLDGEDGAPSSLIALLSLKGKIKVCFLEVMEFMVRISRINKDKTYRNKTYNGKE
jgi:hypothetical protein